MFSWSIRSRLTFWYALSLALVLGGSGAFWYAHLSTDLLKHLDERLLLIAEDVASFYLEVHHEQNRRHQDPCGELEDFARRHTWGEYVQLYDDYGNITCYSSNLQNFRLPLSKAAMMSARQGTSWRETESDLAEHPIRILTYPVVEQGNIVHLIQVGANLQEMENTLRDLLVVLAIYSPLAVLILTFCGWLLARGALSPLDRIIREAQRINAEHLSVRLPVGKTQDEIAQVAETFNATLDRLEEAFKKVRQFSADASHELRTPLAILRGETEVALRWAKDTTEYRQTLESNLEEIDRMGRIIQDLLTLSKSEAGESPLVVGEFSLTDLLQDLYLQGKTLGDPKGIAVSLNLQVTEDIRMKGDKLRLHQMFLNLVSNAVKYSLAGGKVEITLALQEPEVMVAVSDTGIGIAEEHLPHIFDRFYRVDEARNREEGGAGLGLAIVKWIVDAHHGRIEVDSAPGQGSTFAVYLPREGPPQKKK